MIIKLCECGCGEEVSPGSRFLPGHNNRGKLYWKTQQEPTLCKCGCGEYALPGNDYIQGHNRRNKKHSPKSKLNMAHSQRLRSPPSDKTLKKISNSSKKENLSDKTLKKMSDSQSGEKNSFYGKKHSPKSIEKMRKSSIGRFVSDETKLKISNTLKDSCIFHHYIYDHDNPELYTMKVTRSKHQQIHGWIRRSGMKIPHINVTEKNKNVFKYLNTINEEII